MFIAATILVQGEAEGQLERTEAMIARDDISSAALVGAGISVKMRSGDQFVIVDMTWPAFNAKLAGH